MIKITKKKKKNGEHKAKVTTVPKKKNKNLMGTKKKERKKETQMLTKNCWTSLEGEILTKEGGTDEGEESEGESDNLSREELEAELRGGDTTKQAPVAISGENVYTVWWTNNTANGNDEVMFRASIDGGTTFGNKTNLSNTTSSDSEDAEIAAEGGNVIVTWWERNQTANEPIARISTDNGATFGPMLVLAANGTIGQTAEEE